MSNSEDSHEDEVCRVAESLVEVITSAVTSDDDLEQVKILIEDVDDAKVRQETLIIWVGLLQAYNEYREDDDERFAKLATALKSADEGRQAAIVGRLLDMCPDQDEMRKICTGDLLTACKNLNVPMVEVLLCRGANPYSRHNRYLYRRFQNISPIELSLSEFYRAAEAGLATTDHRKVINLLLDKKEMWEADQSDTKVEEATVRSAAIVAGRFDDAKQLIIDRGVDVNATVESGCCGIKFPLGEVCRMNYWSLAVMFGNEVQEYLTLKKFHGHEKHNVYNMDYYHVNTL